VICDGYGQGVALLIQVLAKAGAKRLAVEDPSADDDARVVAAAAGLEVVGVPVDRDGVRVDALDRTDADALILTPSHQWPTGGVLSAECRAAVLRFDRHLRRMRPAYRRRRDALLEALREKAPDLEPAGVAAGLRRAVPHVQCGPGRSDLRVLHAQRAHHRRGDRYPRRRDRGGALGLSGVAIRRTGG
jgi:DNA-binding transcriptional MocR family regulator